MTNGTYRDGWGVLVLPVWEGEDEPERIVEIEVEVVRLSPATESQYRPGSFEVGEGILVPGTCFEPLEDLRHDDTHDLRDRWFQSESEAREHAEYTRNRFANPSPWESFVELG